MCEQPTTVIVGCGESESVIDALALGFLLAERPGWRLLLAHAYAPRALAREDAELLLHGALRALPYGQPAGIRALESDSPGSALSELAREERAHVVVVGASGGVAEQLASSGACPVAVAPRGFGSLRAAA
jgi:hypothetical protein